MKIDGGVENRGMNGKSITNDLAIKLFEIEHNKNDIFKGELYEVRKWFLKKLLKLLDKLSDMRYNIIGRKIQNT